MRGAWICLVYHEVLSKLRRAGGGPSWFATSAPAFERQLDSLRSCGLRAVTIEEALRAGDPNRLAISFDDGTSGQYEFAYPALVARNMSATFFVTVDWIGKAGYMSWDQLREMKSSGMSVQSHTLTHPFLSELEPAELYTELRDSKARLDDRLDQNTACLALPGGDMPTPPLRYILKDAGYSVVATSRWGSNDCRESSHSPRFIRRCTLRGEPPEKRFQRIAVGDWRLTVARRVRDGTLGGLRRAVGPTRYSRWRRLVLDSVNGGA